MASLGPLGCAGAVVPPSPVHVESSVPASPLPSGELGRAILMLLRDGGRTPERQALLDRVVITQLGYANEYFAQGSDQRGAEFVLGALLLVREGELSGRMLDESADHAVERTIRFLSPSGHEGAVEALSNWRLQGRPTAEQRQEINATLARLHDWMQGFERGGPLARLGSLEDFRVGSALTVPTDASTEAAAAATRAWIDSSLAFHIQFRQAPGRVDHDEAMEAARALETGAITLAGLYLRSGRAMRAVEAIEASGAHRAAQSSLNDAIRAAAESDEVGLWLRLALGFSHDAPGWVDPQVVEAARWGSSLEAYRLSPKSYAVARLLVPTLVKAGLAAVIPSLLTESDAELENPDVLSEVLGVTLQAAAEDLRLDIAPPVFRLLEAARPLIERAEAPRYKGKVQPSAARARALWGTAMTRTGNLDGAATELSKALEAEPALDHAILLARVLRQRGQETGVGEILDAALEKTTEPTVELADGYWLATEIKLAHGDRDGATARFKKALEANLQARKPGLTPFETMRLEHLLGHMLLEAGDGTRARRAYERSFDAARTSPETSGLAMLQAAGAGLAHRDLRLARAAVRFGLDSHAPGDDLLYAGLWLSILERRLSAPSDGTAELALSSPKPRNRWAKVLEHWWLGKVSDSDFHARAQTPSQKIESVFYTVARSSSAGSAEFAPVAQAPSIDLFEVQLARELVAPRDVYLTIPAGLVIP